MPRPQGNRASVFVLLAAAGPLACATTAADEFASLGAPRVDMPEDGVDNTPPMPAPKRQRVSILEYAKTYRNPQACEVAARRMRQAKPKKGWALMRACVARSDFTEIDRALQSPWIEDVRQYPRSGARMVSQLVANRGGNLKLDLGLVNDLGVQLFDLSTAMASGRVFRGRMVLMRGKVKKMEPIGPRMRLELAETTLEAENHQETWRHYSKRRDKEYRRRRSRRGSRSSRRSRSSRSGRKTYFDERGSDDGGSIDDGPRKMSTTKSTETRRYVVTLVDKMPKDLKLGEEFLFLVRFEQLDPKTRGNPDAEMKFAEASLVGHFEPLEDIP